MGEETRRKKLEIRNGEWEQGRAKPNPQAAALVLLVRRYPTRWSAWKRWRLVDGMGMRRTHGNRKNGS